jgi:hypothetical protein
VLSQESDGILQGDSQIIVTTHDPMMIGSLRREQVRILRNEGGAVCITEPTEHPRGMGVAGLLKSEYWGLPSTLDSHTLAQIDRRNALIALRADRALTPDELVELDRLQTYLDDLGFPKVSRDPLYEQFIAKMYAVRSMPLDRILSPAELAEQEALAEAIVKDLVKRERTDDLSAPARLLKLAAEHQGQPGNDPGRDGNTCGGCISTGRPRGLGGRCGCSHRPAARAMPDASAGSPRCSS